jgi:hypothetical protein
MGVRTREIKMHDPLRYARGSSPDAPMIGEYHDFHLVHRRDRRPTTMPSHREDRHHALKPAGRDHRRHPRIIEARPRRLDPQSPATNFANCSTPVIDRARASPMSSPWPIVWRRLDAAARTSDYEQQDLQSPRTESPAGAPGA